MRNAVGAEDCSDGWSYTMDISLPWEAKQRDVVVARQVGTAGWLSCSQASRCYL